MFAMNRRPASRAFIAVLIAAAAPSLTGLSSLAAPAEPAAHLVPGDATRMAPQFTLTDINPRSSTHGETLSLSDLYSESGVILNFIASWCAPCWGEAPDFQKLRDEGKWPIVCVAADEHGPTEDLLRKAEQAGLTLPILHVPRDEIAAMESLYDHAMLPATYLIDTTGAIREVLQGAITPSTLVDRAGRVLPRD